MYILSFSDSFGFCIYVLVMTKEVFDVQLPSFLCSIHMRYICINKHIIIFQALNKSPICFTMLPFDKIYEMQEKIMLEKVTKDTMTYISGRPYPAMLKHSLLETEFHI